MRIGLDGLPLAQTRTGVGHYTFELAYALASIAPADEFELVLPSRPSSTVHIEPDRTLPPNLRIAQPRVNALSRRGWWAIGLPRYCKRASLDLFHGTNFAVPLWSRCPTVLTIHDLSLFLYPETHEKHLVRRARRNLPLMARRAAALITPSEAVRREVIEILRVNPDRIVSIPEAARNSFHRVAPPETVSVRQRLGIEDGFILFVGTVEPRKNVLNLVRALDEILRTTHFRPQLVIAGKEGWLTEDLKSYLTNAEIRERVLFTGHLSDNDLRALYSSCRVFVYPSLYEGFGLPLLEAMACGAPVVTSDVPSIVETVGNVARLISPTDVGDIAHGITSLLRDDKERESRSAAGIEHARKFSWEGTAAATLDLYRQVISQKRSRNV